MSKTTTICWFRQDLRLTHNPALEAASDAGKVLPLYIHDEVNCGEWGHGAASRWWLHQSLTQLDADMNGRLCIQRSDPLDILVALSEKLDIQRVYWNRCYEPWQIKRDKQIKQALESRGIAVTSCNGNLLWEPWENLKDDGSPYKVFTPFFKSAMARLDLPALTSRPDLKIEYVDAGDMNTGIDQLGLMPKIKWYEEMAQCWSPGTAGAQDLLQEFLQSGLQSYPEGRDFPDQQSVSRLSPHLHFGEISPLELAHRVRRHGEQNNLQDQAFHYIRELAWREFSHYVLYHFPDICERNMKSQFDDFPWLTDANGLERWQQGQTGYPLVDAGMRELWQTGYMHNRVRMIVASFLTKNLMLHWKHGARWFWDCLLDADLANNSASWQWVAGSGTDAAPYFRIFNPVTQSLKFDSAGAYIKRYVPELENLPEPHLHDPSSAPQEVLHEAGVKLGETYPRAMVNLKETRERALNAYKSIREG